MKKVFLAVLLVVFSHMAYSEQAFENGYVSWLLVHNGPSQPSDGANRVLINLSGTMEGSFCGASNWTIVLNNETAQAQYSFLLAAYMAGKEVRLTGNPEMHCDGSREIVRNVETVQ